MKIEKTYLQDHQVQLNVDLDAETFDKSKRLAARKISRSRKIQGFRPGKAPYSIVIRHVGEAAVIEEALEHLVDDIYPKLLDEQDISPYGPGHLNELKQLDPPKLEFIIPLAPEVQLGDYLSVRKAYELPEVTEEEVDKVVENLRAREAKTELVDRAAETGDMLLISLQAREKDSPEGEEPLVEMTRIPVLIETEDVEPEQEWPFPGFSNALIGLVKEQEALFSHDYSEDYEQDDRLTGKSVEFKVLAHEVRSHELPELTDEFAKELGEYETVADLRADARKHLESSAHENYEESFRSELLDRIVEESEFHFPPQMLKDEIDKLMDQFKKRLANEGWDLDIYLKTNEKDQETLRDEFREKAEGRIRRGLVIMEIAAKEEITVSEQEIQSGVQRTVETVNRSFSPQKARKILNNDMLRGLVSKAMRDTLAERTLARMKAIAIGEVDGAADPASEDAGGSTGAKEEAASAEPESPAGESETSARGKLEDDTQANEAPVDAPGEEEALETTEGEDE